MEKDYKKILELHMLYAKNGYVHWSKYLNEVSNSEGEPLKGKEYIYQYYLGRRVSHYRMVDGLQFAIDNYEEALENCTEDVIEGARLYDEYFMEL